MNVCPHVGRRKGVSRRCVLPDGHGVPIHSYQEPRRESADRAADERIYRKRAKEWLEGRRCQSPKGCFNQATEVHHRAGRSGWRLLDETKWSGLCSSCHAYFTREPAEAYRLGISERRVGAA